MAMHTRMWSAPKYPQERTIAKVLILTLVVIAVVVVVVVVIVVIFALFFWVVVFAMLTHFLRVCEAGNARIFFQKWFCENADVVWRVGEQGIGRNEE